MVFWKAFLLTLLALAVLGGFLLSLSPGPPTLQESTSAGGGNATPDNATGNATNATGNATPAGVGNTTLTPPVT